MSTAQDYAGDGRDAVFGSITSPQSGGYERSDVTQEEWRVDMNLAGSISDPDSPVHSFASFVVEDGKPGAEHT